jgi:hypothetical protein
MGGPGTGRKPGEGAKEGKGNGESHVKDSYLKDIATSLRPKSPANGGPFQEPAERLDPLGVETMSERFRAAQKGMQFFEEMLMSEQVAEYMGDAPTCSRCGLFTIRSGSCYRCLFCGESQGCS